MAQIAYPSFDGDLEQNEPIAPEKIGVNSIKFIQPYGNKDNSIVFIDLLGGSNWTLCFQ